jgi:hypothetical protein
MTADSDGFYTLTMGISDVTITAVFDHTTIVLADGTINVAPSSTDPVYDMMGRKVADSLPVDKRLPRGVYIYRGKKYISVP